MKTSAHIKTENRKQRKDTGAQTQNRTQNLIRFKLVPSQKKIAKNRAYQTQNNKL